jgi:hypothetical protein
MIELIRLIAEATTLAGGKHPCAILGHKWQFTGGSNCGCEGVHPDGGKWNGHWSVPVHKCESCGDYDYGDNDEARTIRGKCAEELTGGGA